MTLLTSIYITLEMRDYFGRVSSFPLISCLLALDERVSVRMCLSVIANPSLYMTDRRFWQSDDHPTVPSVLLHTHIYSNIHMGLAVKTKQ